MNTETSQQLNEFVGQQRSLMIATLTEDNSPHASYAPFVRHEQQLYIFVSQLAAHTRNLLLNPRCHAMIIADEKGVANVFARKRFSFEAQTRIVSREAPEFSLVMRQFRHSFGPTIDTLIGLPDFILFALAPSNGLFVQGFGRATPAQLS